MLLTRTAPRQLAGLCPELVREGTKSVTVVARRDFAGDLYAALSKREEGQMAAFAPKHATWPTVLRAAIQHTSVESLTKTHWIDSIAAAMQASGIEWVPGQHRKRLTHKRIIRFVGSTTPTAVLSARPGGLKRAALEAEQRMLESSARKRLRKRRVDFGCELPFETVPRLIRDGFERLDVLFSKGDHKVLEHYQLARNVLGGCLGEPLCDLMLILALTLGASSVTPFVAPKQHSFSAAPHRKDPALLAANMVTRMLWFLKPESFPWDQDDGPILRVSEMTKKIEHKGVSNRVLRELGWIRVKNNRDSPRNSESVLAPASDLVSFYKELIRLRKEPDQFIDRIFHGSDSIWRERCGSIVREY